MDKIHRNIIRQNAVLLTRDLQVTEEFLSVFVSNSLMPEAKHEELLLPSNTMSRRSNQFQMDIVKRGPKAFSVFIDALVQTSQLHIAEALDPGLTKYYAEQHGILNPSPPKVHMQETTPPAGKFMDQSPLFGGFSNAAANNENSAFMTINPGIIAEQDKQRVLAQMQQQDVYDIKHTPRGYFVIINNEYFWEESKKSEREGSTFDVWNLSELAKKMHFTDVTKGPLTRKELRNLTGKDIKSEILTLSKHDFSDHDALVICVMSHGAQGKVYGVDGVPVDIEMDICAPFDGLKCPTLSGKPKIFIIQACQGTAATTGVPQADDDDEQDAAKASELQTAMSRLRVGDKEGEVPIRIDHKIPHKADTLVAYSTVNGYKSWRRPDLGSWFIRKIVSVFSEYAHKEDVQSLFTIVKRKVADEKTAYQAGDEYIQMPRTDSTLRKKLYFMPGYLVNKTTSSA